MSLKKYKYYFKKPKSEIVKDILYWLMVSGAVVVAGTSPYFLVNFLKSYKKFKKYPKKKLTDTFSYLRRRGFIDIEKRGHRVRIALTEEGKRKAGFFQINDLEIKRPKKWDKIWRIAIFDVPQLKKTHRDGLREKLKELGFYQLQKSVWVHAFDCRAEIELLRDFFGLTEKEMRLILAKNIGDDSKLRDFFNLK